MDTTDLYRARLALLYRISHRVVTSHGLGDIVDLSLEGLQPLIPVWRSSVTLFHRQENEATVYAARGQGSASTLGGTGERISLQAYGGDLALLDRGQPDLLRHADGDEGFRSRVLVPLHVEGDALGSLNLASEDDDFFTDVHLEIAAEVASQLAVAVHQSILLERAQAATRAKSTFLANMSHELRTPLNAILGYTELLQENEFEPSVRQDLDRVSMAAKGLVDVIGDVLDLSQIEAGRTLPIMEWVGVDKLLSHVDVVARPLAKTRGNQLEIHCDSTLESLYTDASKLTQILSNLVINAVTFTEHGHVTLHVDVVADTMRFVVRDTGMGMAPDVLSTVFDAFIRTPDVPCGVQGGTGLGLTLAQQFAHLLGGRLTVKSVVDEGTEFTLTLPMRTPS